MGIIDTESKLYFSKNLIFADMFNFNKLRKSPASKAGVLT